MIRSVRPADRVRGFIEHPFTPPNVYGHAALLFISAFIGGIAIWDPASFAAAQGYDSFGAFLESKPEDHSWLPPSASIFLNNIRVSMLAFGFGGATLGIVSVGLLVVNGVYIGVVAEYLVAEGYVTWPGLAAAIAPHAVFELPAIFLAGALGMRLGAQVLDRILDRDRSWPSWATVDWYLDRWLVVCIALAIAAIVEVHVSTIVLEAVMLR